MGRALRLLAVLACLATAQQNPWKEMLRLAASESSADQQRAGEMLEELGAQFAQGDAHSIRRELLPLLTQALKSPKTLVRQNSVSLLATIATVREDSAQVLEGTAPALAACFTDKDEEIRLSAVIALASQQPTPPHAAIAELRKLALTQLAGKPDQTMLAAAVSGLAECVKCPEVEPVILQALDATKEPESRRRLIMAVGSGRGEHPRVLQRLAQLVSSETGKPRLAAVLALGNAGPDAQFALPVLEGLAGKVEDDPELEQATMSAIRRIKGH
jgi:hypothetical protein